MGCSHWARKCRYCCLVASHLVWSPICAVTRIICHRYGDDVAGSLCNPLFAADTNLLSPDWAISIDPPIWMKASHRDMLLVMQHLPKKTILDYLKHIPAYAQPSYNFRYISSCAS